MRAFLITTILLVTLYGCAPMMLVVMGVKSPKPETTKSLLRYEEKVGYDTGTNNFFIDSSKIEETWDGAFPKGFIYDKSGKTLYFLDCFGESVNQLKYFFNLPKESHKPISDTLRLIMGQDTLLHIAPDFSEIVRESHSLSGESALLQPGTDYYVVYFWSKAFGRINKKYGSKMEKYIKEHPEFNAAFIKINCDYQKEWGYSKKELKTKWK